MKIEHGTILFASKITHVEQCNWAGGYVSFYYWPERYDFVPVTSTVAIWKVKHKTNA